MEDWDLPMAFYLVVVVFAGLVLVGRSSTNEEASKAREACTKAGGEFLAIEREFMCFAPGVLLKK